MRLRLGLYVVLAFGLVVSGCKKEAQKTETIPAIVVYAKGDAKLIRGEDQPKQMAVREPLKEGDVIKTGAQAKVVLQIKGWGVVRVAQKSELELTSIGDKKDAIIDLRKGKVFNNVIKQIKKRNYSVKTPTAVAAVRGTRFGMTFDKKKTKVFVSEGTVGVKPEGSGKETAVETGKTAVLKKNKIKVRKINKNEEKALSILAKIPYLDSLFGGGDDAEGLNQIKAVEEEPEEKAGGGYPKTLAAMRDKYGKVYTVVLFNGQTLKGAILKRGKTFTILTTAGIKKVAKKDIKQTKVLP